MAEVRYDAIAGVTTAAVVIPQAMAYATIAGLPVEVGLYMAAVPLLAYSLLGTSRALSVSTTSTLAMLTGGLLVAASVFRLGFIADFISHPVLAGFKAGTGLLIASGQLGSSSASSSRATASSRRSGRRSSTSARSTGRPRRCPPAPSRCCWDSSAGRRRRCRAR